MAQPERIDATFLTSAPTLAECPTDELPEVALAGRSNAGKSSVLNAVTGNRRLARTSKTPGRTQLLNFFSTPLGGRLVDLPGYGYARTSKAAQRGWQNHVEQYLSERENLVAVVLVMDIRHPFEPFDTQLIEWARRAEIPLHLLLNKADKLRHGARLTAERLARANLPSDAFSIQLFSATTSIGRAPLIERLTRWLTMPLAER